MVRQQAISGGEINVKQGRLPARALLYHVRDKNSEAEVSGVVAYLNMQNVSKSLALRFCKFYTSYRPAAPRSAPHDAATGWPKETLPCSCPCHNSSNLLNSNQTVE